MQVPNTAVCGPLRLAFVGLASALILVGCRKEETRTYSVAKEKPGAAASSASSLRWTTPAGWQEQPASGMRVGSFTIQHDGQEADVSVIPLAGPSGGVLSNVNRWRGQVGLEPIDEAQLRASTEEVLIGGRPGSLYDLSGTDPQTQQKVGLLAAIFPGEGTTWFFKMVGPDTLVAREKSVFKTWLESIQLHPGQPRDPVVEAHRFMDPAAAVPAGLPAHGTGSEDKPVLRVPEGWQEQVPSSMRVASFLVRAENQGQADISVIKLSGMAGGVLSNVNRWRSQLGLEPVEEQELEKLLLVKELNGTKATFVELAGRSVETGDPARLLAGIVPRGGSTWFYRMLGDDQLVARQKDAFIHFVETAQYPHAP
jgi:hypothetical protein